MTSEGQVVQVARHMAAEMWLALLFIASACKLVNGERLFILKCCPQGRELLPSLRECTPSKSVNQSNERVDVLTEDFSRRNITSTQDLENMYTVYNTLPNPKWLPIPLWNYHNRGLLNITEGRPNNCNRILRIKVDENHYTTIIHVNGTLEMILPTVFNNSVSYLFDPEDYCVDGYTDESDNFSTAILVCPCDRVKCVNKCCPFGQVMLCDARECDCKYFESEWKPIHPQLSTPQEDFPYAVIDDEVPSCEEGFQPFMDLSTIFPKHLLRSFWKYPEGKLFNGKDICADTLIKAGVSRPEMIRCGSVLPYWATLSISYWLHVPEVLLLAFTVLTILIVPRTRMSPYSYTHDYAMVCHSVSLLVRGIIWSVFTKSRMTEALCTYPPIIVYFTSLTAAFWLNVICINMTSGFWKPLARPNGRLKGAKTMFLCYSIYAWGASFALTAFATAMWFLDDIPGSLVRPTFHETRTCFREEDGNGKLATFAYFFGPLLALLLVNAALFGSTASRVILLRKNTKILGNKVTTGRDTAPHNRRSVMVYIKLLWLMGLLEVAVEAAAWASNSNEYYFSTAASCIDLLRAVAIFVLHCCKKRTLRALRDRLRRCCSAASAQAGGKPPRTTSISLSTITETSVATEAAQGASVRARPAHATSPPAGPTEDRF